MLISLIINLAPCSANTPSGCRALWVGWMWIKYSLWNPRHLLGTDIAGPGTLVVLKGKPTTGFPNSWGWLLYNISTLSLLSMSQGLIFSVVPCPTALTRMAGLHRALLMWYVLTAGAQLELPVVAGIAKTSVSILYFLGKNVNTVYLGLKDIYHWVSRRSVKIFSSKKIKYSVFFMGTNTHVLPYFPSTAHVSLLIAVQASSLAVNARI